MKIFLAYLRRRRGELLLLLSFWLVLVLVYRLYGLPWGPALYVCLLTTCMGIAAMAADFGMFRRRMQALGQLRRQADQLIDRLPETSDPLETAYQQLMQAVEERRRAAEQEAARQSEVAARYYTRWSHQVKTPIAAIRLLLQEESMDRRALERELLKIEQYVEMALQYQRLDSRTNDLLIRRISLADMVRQALVRTAPLFIHRHLHVELGELEVEVLTDEKWLVFVLEQLLTNAAKYTEKGGVSLLLLPDRDCTLAIRDTGIGILPEDLPRIFDWGYTGYNGRLDKRSTGIGLSLCKQAMDLLGHGITVESTVGEGTTVLLDLARGPLEVE